MENENPRRRVILPATEPVFLLTPRIPDRQNAEKTHSEYDLRPGDYLVRKPQGALLLHVNADGEIDNFKAGPQGLATGAGRLRDLEPPDPNATISKTPGTRG